MTNVATLAPATIVATRADTFTVIVEAIMVAPKALLGREERLVGGKGVQNKVAPVNVLVMGVASLPTGMTVQVVRSASTGILAILAVPLFRTMLQNGRNKNLLISAYIDTLNIVRVVAQLLTISGFAFVNIKRWT